MKIDFIGDVHGCLPELLELFSKLGYNISNGLPIHPENRRPFFIGDLTDRGPDSLGVIELVYGLVEEELGFYVPGNHCDKLYRYLLGNNVQVKHGLETTVAELQNCEPNKRRKLSNMFMQLYKKAPLYKQIPELGAVAAHAGIKESLIGKEGKKVKSFVLYGDTTGEMDELGRPVRLDWAKHYHGKDWIIYGHTPVLEARVMHHTINIDTGCVFGNKLTACRFPEQSLHSVPSQQPFVEEKFRSFD